MKIALIGVGKVARVYLRALSFLPEIELSAACDPNAAHLEALPSGVARYATAEQLLQQSSDEVIVISSPTVTHLAYLKLLIASSRSIAVEKPMICSAEQLAEIERITHDQPADIYGMFHYAFSPEVVAWKRTFPELSGLLGELVSVECAFFDPYAVRGQLVDAGRSLLGSWVDSGINALSVLDELQPQATFEVLSATMGALGEIPVAGNVSLLGRSGSSTFEVRIETNWMLNVDSKTSVLHHQNASVTLNHSTESIEIAWRDGRREQRDLASDEPAAVTRYRGLFDALQTAHSSNASNLATTLKRHRLLIAALDAACWNTL